MPIPEKRLRVYPNPWLQIDHLGRPCCVVRLDYHEHSTNRQWVGATMVRVTETVPSVATVIKGKAFPGVPAQHDHEFEFAQEPVELPNTPYYRENIASGALVAADERTALACNISKKEFQDPLKFLAAAKEAGIRDFEAHTGAGAFEALAQMRAETAAKAAEVARAVAGEDAETPKVANAAPAAGRATKPTTDEPKGS